MSVKVALIPNSSGINGFSKLAFTALFCLSFLVVAEMRARSHGVRRIPELNPLALASADLRPLEPGTPVERELQADASHSYEVTLAVDQCYQAVVEQRGINVVMTVVDPAGNKLTELDDVRGKEGSESLTFISETGGHYRFEVRAAEKSAASGRYQIQITALRAPNAEDRELERARRLSEESRSLRGKGKYDQALQLAERVLEIREKVLGANDLAVAKSLHALAGLYDDKGDYVKAEPLNLRALAIREKILGPNHPDVAWSLFNLAWIFLSRQDFTRAEQFYLRAAMIQENALGKDHPDVATMLNDLAILYNRRGDYHKAIEIDQRVLSIREKALGPDNDSVAKVLSNLAFDYIRTGDYGKAELLLQRALPMWEKAKGADHPEVAFAVNNLGLVYLYKGDYEQAESFQRRALSIHEKTLGPEHSLVAVDLIILGGIYYNRGEYDKAEPLERRALALREKILGPDHFEVAEILVNLGHLLRSKGNEDAEAESVYKRALAIFEKSLGPENPKVAFPLIGLADVYSQQGDYARAEPLYQRALAVLEKTIGPLQPAVADIFSKLATLYRGKGETQRALTALTRANEIRERNLAYNLPLGSERQKLSYLNLFANDIDNALSLHARLAPNSSEALRLAFTTLLQRKGRVLDEMSDSVSILRDRANAQDRELFSQLSDARSLLANLSVRGPGKDGAERYQTQFKEVEKRVDRLEADLSARSAEFRARSQPASLEAIQRLIPAGTTLIEFAVYKSGDHAVRSTERTQYAAYLLGHDDLPRWVDLGDSSAIDQAIASWRSALRDPNRSDVGGLARAVDAKVMQPVRALLGESRHLLISPDGPLNLIPFAALIDEKGKYLVEGYTISYLTSGRDLLRLQVPRASKGPPVVVADPAFGDPELLPVRDGTDKSGGNGRSRVDYSQMFFGPLPGVGEEVRTLRALLPRATFLTREQATKAALERLSGPSILHIATHGFFLESGQLGTDNQAAASRQDTRFGGPLTRVENPLLRSGLALAGANQIHSKGILTAFEAISLDLWGTKLVVLSACDTGVGQVKNGDGVYGLRRALVVAGSESQLMSLWPVSDRSTRDLMAGYYKALIGGEGRGEALRLVQLQILRNKIHSHPYYWASFIQTGEWASLDGKR